MNDAHEGKKERRTDWGLGWRRMEDDERRRGNKDEEEIHGKKEDLKEEMMIRGIRRVRR